MTDDRKVVGRGRGLNRSNITTFKPPQCLIKPEEIIAQIKDTEDKEIGSKVSDDREIDNIVIEANTTINNVDNLCKKLIENEFNEENENDYNDLIYTEVENHNEFKPIISPVEENILNKNPSSDNTISILMKAVSVPEFVPSACSTKPIFTFTYSETTNDQSNGDIFPETHDDSQVTIDLLQKIINDLIHDPSFFEDILENLTEHLFYFCNTENTLTQIVNVITDKALASLSFQFFAAKLCNHFDKTKAIDIKDGPSFRKIFMHRCQEDFKKMEQIFATDRESTEQVKKITNCALWFGELLVNMKLIKDNKPNFNPAFKSAVFKFVDMFLESKNEIMLNTMTLLLKLVGPGLDLNRPQDVDDMFAKLRDFLLENHNLNSDTKESLWKVYKLHTRDWDRPDKRSSPIDIDWKKYDEYEERPLENLENDEEGDALQFEAYDEFLKVSGQLKPEEDCDDDGFEYDAYDEFLKISGQI
ncbi:uncharacterized protein LOC100201888 isoform X1 [Hydra vulgaris]|uniref:Polyadenylate-binding protein-interacting protein 1 n=1 Tax=Hydra vulgaris TaxID=6087 RepID=T2M5R7_HYDVU|nr:uncharacterized protein LOC100201888 [Hydra vulgaris]